MSNPSSTFLVCAFNNFVWMFLVVFNNILIISFQFVHFLFVLYIFNPILLFFMPCPIYFYSFSTLAFSLFVPSPFPALQLNFIITSSYVSFFLSTFFCRFKFSSFCLILHPIYKNAILSLSCRYTNVSYRINYKTKEYINHVQITHYLKKGKL